MAHNKTSNPADDRLKSIEIGPQKWNPARINRHRALSRPDYCVAWYFSPRLQERVGYYQQNCAGQTRPVIVGLTWPRKIT